MFEVDPPPQGLNRRGLMIAVQIPGGSGGTLGGRSQDVAVMLAKRPKMRPRKDHAFGRGEGTLIEPPA